MLKKNRLVALMGLLGSLNLATAGITSAQPMEDQSNTGPVSANTAIGPTEQAAQVITVGKTGILSSVDLSIRKFSTTTGDLVLQIKDVTSGEPGATILASKDFDNSVISLTTEEYTTFDLSSLQFEVTAGDVIAIVISRKDGIGTFTTPIALTDTVYSGGNFYARAPTTGWFTFGNHSSRFRTFVEDPVKAVGIDIKPGSDPNSINLCSNGVVPIAVLGSATLDVTTIKTSSLRFAEAAVKVVGKKSEELCGLSDVNGDGHTDLVCKFVTSDIAAVNGQSSTASVNGELQNGTAIVGSDTINVVKDTCN